MKYIYIIDLKDGLVKKEEYNFEKVNHYGRGLAKHLVERYVEKDTRRFDYDNAIVMAPGLFSGTLVPSTGRLVLATKAQGDKGVQISNLSGSIAQKLASLNIAALVIKGECEENNKKIIAIDKDGIKVVERIDLAYKKAEETIDILRRDYEKDSAVIGIGPIGENLLALSTLFSTYPEGEPKYYCSRGAFGDVFGKKGLKAVVITTDKYFQGQCYDKEGLSLEAKKLGKVIVNNDICGGALPGYGSITLMKMLKQGRNVEIPVISGKGNTTILKDKVNRTCSPLCVIGCLNRHCTKDEDMFSSPAESEAYAALQQCFGIEDVKFTREINRQLFELGADSIEFLFGCNLYAKANKIEVTKEILMDMVRDLENLTLVGRTIGTKTSGIYNLYKENNDLKDLVSKPSTSQEKSFNISLKYKPKGFENISDLELLYGEIIMLENLGFCLFSSFALIDNEEALNIISNLFYYRTGVKVTPEELIIYGLNCIDEEIKFEAQAKDASVEKTIPEFVKVLYRYFQS